MQRCIVSICGPSGTGKSQTAVVLGERLGHDRSVRVPADYYLVPADGSLDAYLAQPLVYDWALLEQTLALPVGTTVEAPAFDFETFRRAAESGGPVFTLQSLCIVDAMYPCPFADIKIIMRAPSVTRRERVAARDRVWNTSVLDRWAHLELCRAHLDALAVDYDLCLSGLDSIDANAGRISRLVQARREGEA